MEAQFRTRTWYEWDIETVDAHGDVLDHHHADALAELPALGEHDRLVLVYNRGTEWDGAEDRQWAYVADGKLPAAFDGGQPVPKRFHAELARREAQR